ncbi:MAG: polysaccharide deacetylase family protein [Candidatus Portnoybacteria bacterium]|nr:polysaccharide deacetylase family protein [Candidatus Portnoybacteria bacterium]
MNEIKPKIILTFDLEYWHESIFLKRYLSGAIEENISESVKDLLALLKKFNASATFFILGKLAEKYPEAVKEISLGHEIASHGFSHLPLHLLNEKEFEEEIIQTNAILKNITGQNPSGFRAPAFSLNKKTSWALDVLIRQEFKYDSSVFLFKNGIYGETDFLAVSRPNLKSLPPAVYKKSFLKIPVAGGIYWRFLPYFIFKFFIKRMAKKETPVIYFHNHELFGINKQIKKNIKCPFWKKWLKFKGVGNILKFEKLLKDFQCVSIKERFNL